MGTEGPVEIIQLGQGIALELWDKSRILAGDRYYVCMEAKAQIPYSKEDLNSLPDAQKIFEVFKNHFGPTIPYIFRQERHFIDKNEKDKIFNSFVETFKKNKLPYLLHPEFRKRLVISTYRELKQKNPYLFLEDTP